MEKDKFLFVVSGAAGTGKDSVVKALREAHPEIEKIRVCHRPQPPAPGSRKVWITTTAPRSSSVS